ERGKAASDALLIHEFEHLALDLGVKVGGGCGDREKCREKKERDRSHENHCRTAAAGTESQATTLDAASLPAGVGPPASAWNMPLEPSEYSMKPKPVTRQMGIASRSSGSRSSDRRNRRHAAGRWSVSNAIPR